MGGTQRECAALKPKVVLFGVGSPKNGSGYEAQRCCDPVAPAFEEDASSHFMDEYAFTPEPFPATSALA